MKSIFTKNKDKVSPTGTFAEMAEKIAKNGGGTAHIYRKDPEDAAKRFVADKDVKDLKDAEILTMLRNQYGGGDFIIQLDEVNDQGIPKFVKEFKFSVEGDSKESRHESYKRQREDKEMATTITKDVLSFAKEMFPQKDDSAVVAMIQSNANMMQAMMTQFMASQDKQMQMFMEFQKSNQRAGNPVTEALEGIMQLSQVKDMLTPNVSEDKTLEWAKLFMNSPIAGGMLSKLAGVQMQIPEKLPLAELPKPGDDQNRGTPEQNPDIKETTPSEKNQTVSPLNGIDEKDPFEITMIDPIIELINSDADPADIAQAIQQVISWAMTSASAGVEPHPMMYKFAEAIIGIAQGNLDTAKLNDAYIEFAHNIEMPDELINPVKDNLIKLFMPQIMQMKQRQAQANVINMDDEGEAVNV